MAKDGTCRGGARIGAGRKKKSLDEKILEGKAEAAAVEMPSVPAEPPKEYLTAEQKGGGKLYAETIYREIMNWMTAHGCADVIPAQISANYAMLIARHIQAEEKLSAQSLTMKNPKTGGTVISPFVKMSLDYLKHSNQIWLQIYSAVREKAADSVGNADDEMENLLRVVK